MDSKELVNLYLDISGGLLSKLSLNNSTEGNFDKYLFVLALEQSLDSLAVSIASSSEFENPKFSSYDYFTEIFTALETGIIDGADASGLANNVGLGLYDLVKHANFPGFHSMPSDHLACNKAVWDGMPEAHRTIMSVAMEALALRTALTFEKANAAAAAQLRSEGVTLWQWSEEDLQMFRDAAQATWPEFATTPEAKALVASHIGYLTELGLVSN